jgi:hypothetical protein
MNKLLYKEFKLSVHLTSYLFLFLGAMLLIPNYPYYVVLFYQTLGIFFMFITGNATNDVYFTTLLPIRKRDAVKARVITIIIFELLQIIVSIPFAILRYVINPAQNAAGMEANIAFFGLAFMMFGVFNVVFLPGFYKTAYKTGAPYLWSCLAMVLFVAIVEAVIQLVPDVQMALDTTSTAFLPQQLFVLIVGIIVFGVLTVIAHTQSVKRFEQLDL